METIKLMATIQTAIIVALVVLSYFGILYVYRYIKEQLSPLMEEYRRKRQELIRKRKQQSKPTLSFTVVEHKPTPRKPSLPIMQVEQILASAGGKVAPSQQRNQEAHQSIPIPVQEPQPEPQPVKVVDELPEDESSFVSILYNGEEFTTSHNVSAAELVHMGEVLSSEAAPIEEEIIAAGTICKLKDSPIIDVLMRSEYQRRIDMLLNNVVEKAPKIIKEDGFDFKKLITT